MRAAGSPGIALTHAHADHAGAAFRLRAARRLAAIAATTCAAAPASCDLRHPRRVD